MNGDRLVFNDFAPCKLEIQIRGNKVLFRIGGIFSWHGGKVKNHVFFLLLGKQYSCPPQPHKTIEFLCECVKTV